ncbi:MAG: PKD domain-containing protein [Bacteroidota bacterium]
MKTKLFLTVAAILIAFPGCEDYNYLPVDDGKITLGTPVFCWMDYVTFGGGTITLDQPGQPLDGMQIIVESGSFPLYANFSISYLEIRSHTLGDFFNPLTPMIRISCDGGFAEKPIAVKIPITLPEGSFAMGFFYDENTGKLEGMPIDSINPEFIIVSTRHFSSNSSNKLKGSKSEGISYANMVISSALESELNNQEIISSGFTPGVDDWEFVNWGSYIAPGGHCAGQSISAMWYYYEERLNGQKSLFHGFDVVCNPNNPIAMWQDNPLGYRFASTIQEDCWFAGWDRNIFIKSYLGRTNWYAFEYSMLLTGEPQLALVYKTTPNYGGHAVIVYKINVSEGKLYIADPNFPNNRDPNTAAVSVRTIDFVNGGFVPYPSSAKVDTATTLFDAIGYFAKTAYISWEQISRRWAEVEAGTIGNDRFPGYQFYLDSPDGPPLENDKYVDKNDIDVVCQSSGCESYISFTDHLQLFDVFDVTGNPVAAGTNANGGVARINLKPGKNLLGFYIHSKKGGKETYIDFKWLNINYSILSIDPDPLKGVTNREYTLYGRTNGGLPASSKFVWNFGDNTPEVTKINDSTVQHKYEYPGDYIIQVKLYDNAENKEVAEALGNAKIKNQYETLFIEPEHLYGNINREYTFTARTNGEVPADYKFVWGFGDESQNVTKINDSTVTHTFTKEGEFGVGVELFDNATNQSINYKSALATITSSLLEKLKAADRVSLIFGADFTFSNTWWSSNLNIAQYLFLQPGEYSLTWTGNSFDFTFSQFGSGYYDWERSQTLGNIKAEISADGNTINSLTGYQVMHNTIQTDSVVYRIELNNLQYDHTLGNLIYFEIRGPGAASVVKNVVIRRNKYSGEPWNVWQEVHLVSVNYNSSSIPILTVEFWPK